MRPFLTARVSSALASALASAPGSSQAPGASCSLAQRIGSPPPRRRLGWQLSALALLAGLLLPHGAVHAQTERLPPVDAGISDASWVQFHKRLVTAVEQRDLKFLLSILDPKIRNSFEKPDGVKSFVEQWELEPAKAKDSPLWNEMRTMLRFGAAPVESAAGERLLCLPYVAVTWPPTVDPFLYAAVVIADAPVFEKPSTQAQIITTLSHQTVGVEDWDLDDANPKAPQRWVRVVLKTGVGYMASEHIRSAMEARACFTRSRGKVATAGPWRMVSFTVGGG